MPPSSRQLRWCAGLGKGAGSGAEQVGGAVEPDHAAGLEIGRRDGGSLRRIDRRAGMGHAANGTAAIVRAGLAGLIVLVAGLTLGRSRIMADKGRMQRLGGSDA